MSVLDNDSLRGQLLNAWLESEPGTPLAHEEGGFILKDSAGMLCVERWPRGAQNEIFVPSHPDGKRGDLLIVATFHTHPNPGADFQQEPSLTDIRAVRGDANLVHSEYEGEFVIASAQIYWIRKNGNVEIVGKTATILIIN